MSQSSAIKRFLWISTVAILAWIPTAWWVGQWLVVFLPLEKADAIVVLAGSEDYVERTQEAARLYRNGQTRRVLLTDDGLKGGWNTELQRNPYFVERAKWSLLENGVSEPSIEIVPEIVESSSVSGTEMEARIVGNYCREKGISSLLIVTSAYHTRRASYHYNKEIGGGLAKFGIVSPIPSSLDVPNAFWWLSTRSWRHVVGEYSKILYQVIE